MYNHSCCIAFLAAYATELLDGLFLIALDTKERIENITHRLRRLDDVLPQVERITLESDISELVGRNDAKFRKGLEKSVPTIFAKNTNCNQVASQYQLCEAPPALWKLDEIFPEKRCMDKFSFPRFFFHEWARTEIAKQEKKKRERKEEKKRRKKEKAERKKEKKKKGTITPLIWQTKFESEEAISGLRVPALLQKKEADDVTARSMLEDGAFNEVEELRHLADEGENLGGRGYENDGGEDEMKGMEGGDEIIHMMRSISEEPPPSSSSPIREEEEQGTSPSPPPPPWEEVKESLQAEISGCEYSEAGCSGGG